METSKLRNRQKIFVDNVRKGTYDKLLTFLSSEAENDFAGILVQAGLKDGEDFNRQHLFHNDEVIIVTDFTFPKLLLVVELDGSSHNGKVQRQLDKLRDRVCHANGWQTLRIKTPLTDAQKAYWRTFFACMKEDYDNESWQP